jgi:predicted ATPase/DNA-binding XRE family transcriptional regulator
MMVNDTEQSFTSFGEILKHLRQMARMTQDELGLAVGYSRAHIARLENNQRAPDPSAVRARFVEALGLQHEPGLAAQLIELAEVAHGVMSAESSQKRVPSNLPVQLTSFIGRECELVELMALLSTARLITLTGSGGVGKTRLALEVAVRLLDRFRDGVWLVELAPLTDPARVPQTVAVMLGLRDEPGRDIQDTLLEHLSARECLLILDNCEHLIAACARFVDAVLRHTPRVRVIASSREALGIAGEVPWRVPSLAVPEPKELVEASQLVNYAGVQLFVERAAVVSPGFALAAQNADAVRQICYRLDGIPLAIELAAARMRALPVETIVQRLNDRFRLLTGGSRTALPRQQTLRATIDWSYALLGEVERVLLRRLSVFQGGFTLEAAEPVCADADAGAEIQSADVLDVLTALVDKSLVQYSATAGAGRYWLLETIRQYGREKLLESEPDAGQAVRDRHLAYFVRLAESLQPVLEGALTGDQIASMQRVDTEADNFRQALEWAMETARLESFWRLNDSLTNFWIARPLQLEYMDRVHRFLALPALTADDPNRAHAYIGLAFFNQRRNELTAAHAYAKKGLAIGQSIGNQDIQQNALGSLFWTEIYQGDYVQARNHLTTFCTLTHNLRSAFEWHAWQDWLSGILALYEGNYGQAAELLARVHAGVSAKGNKLASSAIVRNLGYAQLYAGDLNAATQSFRESLIDNSSLDDKQAVAACLAALAGLSLAQGDLFRSAQLFGASDGLSDAIHTRILPHDVIQYERNVAELRKRMEATTLEAAWNQGGAMTYDQAIDYALAGT